MRLTFHYELEQRGSTCWRRRCRDTTGAGIGRRVARSQRHGGGRCDAAVVAAGVRGGGNIRPESPRFDKAPMMTNESIHALSLRDIAAWQIEGIFDSNEKAVADLPALQRSAVWKVQQIEELWDSVLRGFPIYAGKCFVHDSLSLNGRVN